MAKLERVTNKIFGETATATGDNPDIGQFGSAKAGTYIGTTDIDTLQALPAYSNGWVDAVTPQNQFPALPEMTAVHKILSYQTGYLMQEGIAEWDANTSYFKSSIVKTYSDEDGIKIYRSKTDENINNPITDGDNWEEVIFNANLFNNKADIDASNFNTDGKTLISGLGMPSNRYVELQVGASETRYTAPANGWFVFGGRASVTGDNTLGLYNFSSNIMTRVNRSINGNTWSVYMPAKTGDIVSITYNGSYSTISVRFNYAEGEA